MKHQKLALGLLLVIGVGLLAAPLGAAQWTGGDADNNEEADFGGGDADNNEEADFGGGDADNNEDPGFDGGDAGNNEDEEEQNQEETTEEEPAQDDDISSAAVGETHVIDMSYTDDFNLQLSPQNVAPEDTVTVSGQLTIEENSEREIDVLLDERRQTTVTTGQNGEFQTEIEAPSESGTYTIVTELDDIRQRAELQVGEGNGNGLSIGSITTSGETRAGQPIQICAEISSATNARVNLYQNNQQVETTTGSGEVCFNPTLESGTNNFRVEATANGETAEASITRTTSVEPGTNGPTAPTGGFLGSPTARVAAVGTIIVLIASAIVLFARQNMEEEPI